MMVSVSVRQPEKTVMHYHAIKREITSWSKTSIFEVKKETTKKHPDVYTYATRISLIYQLQYSSLVFSCLSTNKNDTYHFAK